jgi:pimeloyl-ACP methyl ester carboxylesterase
MKGYEFDTWRLQRRARHLDPQWVTMTRSGIRLIDLPTTQVRVRVAGTGSRTIVFACDMPNVVENYDEVIQQLGSDYRVVCFEQPGFGFSYPKPGFTFTRRAYADALAGMLRELAMGPYILAFPCVSIFYGLTVAQQHAGLIERLVLMQATSWPRQCAWAAKVVGRFLLATAALPLFGTQVTATPFLGQAVWAATEPSFARRTHRHVIYKAAERQELFNRLATPLYAAFDHGACNCMPSAFQHYFTDDETAIARVNQPTLILWATGDRSHKTSDSHGLMAYAPNATWQEVPDTGHHLELENPEVIAGAIKQFLSQVVAG